MSYAEFIAEDQRRAILDTLATDSDFSHNEDVLALAMQAFGHRVGHDKLRTELHWLAEQGLIEIEGDRLLIARLTRRGEDVALGRTTVPGVPRPRL